MRCIYPKAPDDRSMTRQEWKALDGYCRKIDKLITPQAEATVTQSLHDLLSYGCSATILPH